MFPINDQIFRPLWHNGPLPGSIYNFPNKIDNSAINDSSTRGKYGTQHSAQPITTGTSVVGLKFNNGVMIAADNLISYGSTAKYNNIDRVFPINNKIIIGTGGDYADFQCLKRYIDEKIMEDICYADGIEMKPKSLYNWLTRILYNRRNQFNPLWLDILVGGMEDGVPFLGHVNLRGKSYQDNIIASGYGQHIAVPYLRGELEKKSVETLTQAEAEKLINKCMEVLFYRDCRAYNEYKLAVSTSDGTTVKGPIDVNQTWDIADMI